jgi:hypothetical protein
MKRPLVCLLICLLAAAVGCTTAGNDEFRTRGLYNNAVHRFFPDLDQRQNAIRYGRWRALEASWRRGANASTDAEISIRIRWELRRLPAFGPDARLAAPYFAQGAPAAFHAMVAANVFERQVSDALASPDATPDRTARRIDRALAQYRQSPWSLSEPPAPAGPATGLERFESARLLLAGDWLFARCAEDLSAARYGSQRWKTRDTVALYDRQIASPPASITTAWYRDFAPEFSRTHPVAAEILDRVTRFRIELFAAFRGRDPGARAAGVSAVERRYGLSR